MCWVNADFIISISSISKEFKNLIGFVGIAKESINLYDIKSPGNSCFIFELNPLAFTFFAAKINLSASQSNILCTLENILSMKVFCELKIVQKSVGNFMHPVFSCTASYQLPISNNYFEKLLADGCRSI